MLHRLLDNLGWVESALLAIAGLVFINPDLSSSGVALAGTLYPSLDWEARQETFVYVFVGYGLLFSLLAITSLMLARKKSSLLRETLRALRPKAIDRLSLNGPLTPAPTSGSATWVLAVIAVGIALRAYFLPLALRWDEAHTFLQFVNKDFAHSFYYSAPNNHVLHTLLVKLSTSLFGREVVAIRLPAFLAGVVALPLTYLASRRIMGPGTGFVAASFMAVSPFIVHYDTMARGYSMVVALGLWLAIAGFQAASRPSMKRGFILSGITALGMWTMPSFLFPAASVYAWVAVMLARKNGTLMPPLAPVLVPSACVAGLLTCLFYSPVILVSNGVAPIVWNPIVRGLPLAEFLHALPGHVRHTWECYTRHVPSAVLVMVLGLLVMGIVVLFSRRQWDALLMLAAGVTVSMGVLMLKRAIPFERTWIYAVPFVFMYVDAGVTAMTKRWQSSLRMKGLVVLGLAGVAIAQMANNTAASYPHTGGFPEGPVVAQWLAQTMQKGDAIVSRVPADDVVRYYMLRFPAGDGQEDVKGTTGSTFYVVAKRNFTIRALTHEDVKKIFEIGDAEVYVEVGP